jgi:hypothetical protein
MGNASYDCCGGDRRTNKDPKTPDETKPLLHQTNEDTSGGRIMNPNKGNLSFDTAPKMALPEMDEATAMEDAEHESQPFKPHSVRLESYSDGGELDSSRRPANPEQVVPIPSLDKPAPSLLVITYDNAAEPTPRYVDVTLRKASADAQHDDLNPPSGIMSPASAGGSRAVSGTLDEQTTKLFAARYGLGGTEAANADLNVTSILQAATSAYADSDDEGEEKQTKTEAIEGATSQKGDLTINPPSAPFRLPDFLNDAFAETGSGGRASSQSAIQEEPIVKNVVVEPKPEGIVEQPVKEKIPEPVVEPPKVVEPVIVPVEAPKPEPVPEPVIEPPAPEPTPPPPPKPAVKASGIRLTTAPSTATESVASPPKVGGGIRLTTVSSSASGATSQEGTASNNQIKPVTAFRFTTVAGPTLTPESVEIPGGSDAAKMVSPVTVAAPVPAALDFSEVAAQEPTEEADALKSPRGVASGYTGYISRFSTFSRGKQEEKIPDKNEIMLWARRKTRGYDYVQIHDLSSCWKNGMAFCALLHSFDPRSLTYDKLRPRNDHENVELAFSVAEDRLLVPRSLEVDDVVEGIATEDEIYKYLLEWHKNIGG